MNLFYLETFSVFNIQLAVMFRISRVRTRKFVQFSFQPFCLFCKFSWIADRENFTIVLNFSSTTKTFTFFLSYRFGFLRLRNFNEFYVSPVHTGVCHNLQKLGGIRANHFLSCPHPAKLSIRILKII